VTCAVSEKLSEKIVWAPVPVLTLLPQAIPSTALVVYKIVKNNRAKRCAAFVTNAAGLVYTLPL